MKIPALYTAQQIADNQVASPEAFGVYVPARPLPFDRGALGNLQQRFRLAWLVFNGRCDALSLLANPCRRPNPFSERTTDGGSRAVMLFEMWAVRLARVQAG